MDQLARIPQRFCATIISVILESTNSFAIHTTCRVAKDRSPKNEVIVFYTLYPCFFTNRPPTILRMSCAAETFSQIVTPT